jgi:hypothetical protein
MRSFIAACLAILVIALMAAVILDEAVQKPVAVAFSTSEVRL